MPFIHIRSLPFEKDLDISVAVREISRDFSRDLEIDPEHVTVTWEFYRPGLYASAGETSGTQPSGFHPILVDLLVPDVHSREAAARMLTCVASTGVERGGEPIPGHGETCVIRADASRPIGSLQGS